jgi:hypothetical protein
MTTIVKDIEAVLSLRSALRNPTVPLEIIPHIELIHSCIKSGTDTHGWKRTDWRGNGGGGCGGGSTSKGSYSRHGGGSSGSRHYSGSGSHSTFSSSRPRGGAGCTKVAETPASIPLVTTTSNTIAAGGAGVSSSSEGAVRYTSQKYVSKFKKASDKVEDTILNTILLGKLNKFSEVNYTEIKEFITHIIDNGETDMIKCFMKLVFEKAASEEIFCALYAKLLSELSSSYPVLLVEMANLYNTYMAIFEEVKKDDAENYDEFCKRTVEQKYRRGYSQFLAELTKYNIIDPDTLMKTITKIITQVECNIKEKDSLKVIEEYADCLMRIMRAIKPVSSVPSDDEELDHDAENGVALIRSKIKIELCDSITPLTVRNVDNIGLSNKARFTFLNIYEDIQKF